MGKCFSKSSETKKNDEFEVDISLATKLFTPKTNKHLIVDDAIFNREILKKYLETFHIKSSEASDGREALTHNLQNYDIIWMDLRMPIMNGFDCTEKIRNDGYNDIIIGVTGDVSQNNMKTCYDVGMNYVMIKPIKYNELCNNVYIKPYLTD